MDTENPSWIARVWKVLLEAAPIMFWALMGASGIITLFVIGYTLIVWLGGWKPAQADEQLKYLGIGLLCMIGLLGLVIVRLTGASLTGKFGSSEIEVRAGDQAPKVTVSTTVEPPTKG